VNGEWQKKRHKGTETTVISYELLVISLKKLKDKRQKQKKKDRHKVKR